MNNLCMFMNIFNVLNKNFYNILKIIIFYLCIVNILKT